jgi:hypothetical protein
MVEQDLTGILKLKGTQVSMVMAMIIADYRWNSKECVWHDTLAVRRFFGHWEAAQDLCAITIIY